MEQRVVDSMLEHFDHHDDAYGRDPHPVLAAMAARGPVHWSDQHGGYWVITSYEAARSAMRQPEIFNRNPSASVPSYPRERPMIPMELDPPVHGKYRGLLAPVFAPARVAAMEPRIRALAGELIDAFADDGSCELVAALADPFPTTIFTEMLGLPNEEMPRFRDWKNTIIHGVHGDPEQRTRAVDEVNAYLAELLELRRRQPADDIMTVLMGAEVEGEQLTDQEVVDTAFMLFLAGLDTVVASIGLHFLFLAGSPSHQRQIVEDPAIIPQAVEEMLRFESLVTAGYTIGRDAEFFGCELKQGDRAVVSTLAADRDPVAFVDPDQVVFDREPNRHLAFGAGPHRCAGSHLARLELRIAYEEFHARIPSYELAGPGPIRHGSNVQGIDQLHLRWDVAARPA